MGLGWRLKGRGWGRSGGRRGVDGVGVEVEGAWMG